MSKVVVALTTSCQSTLCPCTRQTVIPRWATSSSKGSISRSLKCSQVAQLMTHNCSISKVPVVITHSSPLPEVKDLNTTFQRSIPSHQSNRAFCSCVIGCDIYRNIDSIRDRTQACSFTVPVRCHKEYTNTCILWLLWITGLHSASCKGCKFTCMQFTKCAISIQDNITSTNCRR